MRQMREVLRLHLEAAGSIGLLGISCRNEGPEAQAPESIGRP